MLWDDILSIDTEVSELNSLIQNGETRKISVIAAGDG
jgi:hypothetical protein